MYLKRTPEGLIYVTQTLITDHDVNPSLLKDMDYKRLIFLNKFSNDYSDFEVFTSFKSKHKKISVRKYDGKVADIVYDVESKGNNLMHVKASNMNQVVAKWFKENNIIYALAIDSLDELMFGKIRQNLLLLRKYDVPVILSVFSSKKFFSWFEAMNLLRSIITLK